ncbi:MAG: hypothetical protein H0X40_07890 [Chthoniobacterales bacterium]|nr:hypothetical protein [Chthoniobacterales bacterium]
MTKGFANGGADVRPNIYPDVDLAYAHLFVNDPPVKLLDDHGHLRHGNFDASVDSVSASLTLRWREPRRSLGKTPARTWRAIVKRRSANRRPA